MLLGLQAPLMSINMKGGHNEVQPANGTITGDGYLCTHPSGYVPAPEVNSKVITEVPAI